MVCNSLQTLLVFLVPVYLLLCLLSAFLSLQICISVCVPVIFSVGHSSCQFPSNLSICPCVSPSLRGLDR